MGTAYRFIADPGQPSEVMAWFRALKTPPVEVGTERGTVLYFKEHGALAYDASGAVDSKASPIVTLLAPRVRRGILWTVGEVHFLATPLRKRLPALQKISKEFSEWLCAWECVHPPRGNDFTYYLEGSVRNWDSPVFALDSGLEALRAGRYVVSDDDNEFVLDTLCRKLRLRGVHCLEA
jgi:hypothetical protein